MPDGSLGRIFVKGSLLFGGYTDGRTKEIIDGYMSTGASAASMPRATCTWKVETTR